MQRRLLSFLFVGLTMILLAGCPNEASAQSGFTNVTAQVKDPLGNLYSNCSYNIDFVGQAIGATVPYTIGGTSSFQQSFSGAKCDSSGNLAIRIADNLQINPTPSQWKFSICSSNGLTCFNTTLTITGNNQVITANLQAASATLTGSGTLNQNFRVLNGIRFADQFTGATVNLQASAACTDGAGANITIIIPSTMGTGAITGLPSNCFVVDFRATGETAGSGNFLLGWEFYKRDTVSAAAGTTIRSAIGLYQDDYSGGVNIAGVNKTQSQMISGLYDGRDKGEHHGFVNALTRCQGSGDCLANMHIIYGWGGYGAGGDEGQEAYRGWTHVGDGSSTGSVPTSASITVSGNTISGTWANPHNLGIRNSGLLITNRATYSTGTVVSAAFSGGICHVTGLGTNWAVQYGIGTKNYLFIRFPQFESASAKFTVPVTAVNSATDLSMDYNQNETGAGCPALVAGTYTIYTGSLITALGTPVTGTQDPNSITVADGTWFSNGDAVEQPIDYNVSTFGTYITQYTPFLAGGFHRGFYVTSIGPGKLESGLAINSGVGGYTNGIRLMNSGFDVGITTNALPVFANIFDTTTPTTVLLRTFTSGAIGRSISYDRTNDKFDIGGGFHVDGATIAISTNSSPQPATEFYLGYNNAAWTGLRVANVATPNALQPLITAEGAGTTYFEVQKTGINIPLGTISRGSLANTDLAGTLQLSAGAISRAWTVAPNEAPICTCSDNSAIAACQVQSSNASLTLMGTGNDTLSYICIRQRTN